MKHGWTALIFSVLALSVACSSGAPSAKTAPPNASTTAAAATNPATYTVQVDGKSPTFNAFFLAYFPKELTAHPGDTIQYRLNETGEPHTVTFGTLVDSAVAAIAKAPPGTGAGVPELQKLPELIPTEGGDANQGAAQPCYLDSGAPPVKDACAKAQQQQPEFSGAQAYFNSGWLDANKPFVMKLSKDIKPGTYSLMCLLHRDAMIGKLTVVASNAAVQTPDDASKKAAAELDAKVKALQPLADATGKIPGDKAVAGNLSEQVLDAGLSMFGPKEVSIPVGGTVAWTVLGPHTISFNAPEDAKTIRLNAPDGSVHVNPKAAAPADSAGQPPPPPGAPPAPNPSAPPVVIDGGQWNGSGFKSSGIIVSFPPGPLFAYKVTFSKAGTYQFKCLIHDNMEGTVKVGS